MSAEWPAVPLGSLVSVKGGKRLPKGDNLQVEPTSHPYIRVRDMGQRYLPDTGLEYVPVDVFPKIKRYIVEENDVLISIVGTIGLVSIVDERFHLASQTENCAKLTGLDRIDALFLYYHLISSVGQNHIKQATVGAVQAKLPLYNIEKIPVVWPERAERERAVEQLSPLDDKIELNRQINQTLEHIAQAIFKNWFIDFEPVKAKIEAKSAGRDPERAAMCAISGKSVSEIDQLSPENYQQLAATAALFPDELVESELGLIPEGWGVVSLDSLATKISKGTTPTKQAIASAADDPLIPFIKVKDIGEDGEINRDGIDKIPDSVHRGALKRSILNTSDILFSIAGTIGRVAVVEKDLQNSNANQAVAFVRLKKSDAHLGLCLQFLKSQRLQDAASAAIVQGVQANLSLGSLGGFKILLPSMEVLAEWNNKCRSLFDETRCLARETRTLATLRDSFLPKLLSGELSLAETSISVKGAINA